MAFGVSKSNTTVAATNPPYGAIGRPVFGQNILTIGSTSLTGSAQTPTGSNIPFGNPNGLPLKTLHFQMTVTDTTGNTTAPVTPAVIENVLQEFALYGSRGGPALVDIKGNELGFTRWQHLKNPNGYYVASTAPTDSATATTYTATWNFDLYFSIDPAEFPLRPYTLINTVGSRAATTNLMTSTMNGLTINADFQAHAYRKSRLVNVDIPNSNTGVFQAGSYLDKNVIFLKQAYDVGADTNFNASNTLNFTTSGQQVHINNNYQNLINLENSVYPISTQHIAGFFIPSLRSDGTHEAVLSDYTTTLSFNFSSAPSVNGTSNKLATYWEEAY